MSAAGVSADVILTPRLELHAVTPEEYELLSVDRADPQLWTSRGFSNPYGHLVADPGPLPHRIPRIRRNPEAAPYLLRLAVLRDERCIIGSAGFHDLPNADGMIEVGFGIEPTFRNRGFGKELLFGMWRWVIGTSGVRTLRYTVSPTNDVSQHIVRSLGFAHVGVQIDEEDGPEDVFELSVDEFRTRFSA